MFGRVALTLIAALSVATTAASAQTAPPSEQAAAAPEEKVRCKRYTETGSLAKVRKECHTDAEWQQLAIAGRESAKDMVRRTGALGARPQ